MCLFWFIFFYLNHIHRNQLFSLEFQKPVQHDWRGIYYLHVCYVLTGLGQGQKAKYNITDLKIIGSDDTARNISSRNLFENTLIHLTEQEGKERREIISQRK